MLTSATGVAHATDDFSVAGDGGMSGLYGGVRVGYGVNIGYAHTFGEEHQFYSAIEADYAMKGAYFKVDNDFYGVNQRMGLSVIGGYITPENVLVFGKVGAKSVSVDAGRYYMGKKKGPALGIGVEFPLSLNTNFRGEYEFSTIHGIKSSDGNYDINANNNVFRAGLVYRF